MFSFFCRKKKQETPAQEETRIQETAAEVLEHAETTVSQALETVQENIGEKAEELTAAVETAVENASGSRPRRGPGRPARANRPGCCRVGRSGRGR